MWAEACHILEQAERMHRQFFQPSGARGARTAWEPPVNVFEDEQTLKIIMALPGVAPENVEVLVDSSGIVVRASSDVPFGGDHAAIRRLEIPYGYFERRIPLPTMAFDVAQRELVNGCLILTLRKVL